MCPCFTSKLFSSLSLHLQITHPAGCMSQFIKFFGEQILVLWKFALLRKRILIFSPPPVGVVCYRGMFPATLQSSDLVGWSIAEIACKYWGDRRRAGLQNPLWPCLVKTLLRLHLHVSYQMLFFRPREEGYIWHCQTQFLSAQDNKSTDWMCGF